MKRFSLLVFSLLSIVLFSSCDSKSVVTRATGMAYEVMVVMDEELWEGETGTLLHSELSAPIDGLPQVEPKLKVMQVKPKEFNGFLTYIRNIIQVNISADHYTKVSVKAEENLWANGQMVLTINAPSKEAFELYMAEHEGDIADYFVATEMRRTIKLLEDTYSGKMNEMLADYGMSMHAPEEMKSYRQGDDFVWASNNANTGRTDIVVYTFPYTDKNAFTAEYLLEKRDSVLKANIPGSFPGSFMTTEHRFGVSYTPITINGAYCAEMRGLWKVQGDMMGGPFVSLARLDEKNQRVVVAEAFVFAPETDKRNFMRRAEAALYTLRLPGEAELPAEDFAPYRVAID